jgi:hypothetical protein
MLHLLLNGKEEGQVVSLSPFADETVFSVKWRLAYITQIPAKNIQITCRGRIVRNDETIESLGMASVGHHSLSWSVKFPKSRLQSRLSAVP